MEKRCGGCGETKPIKQFSKNKGSQDGLQGRCKVCAKNYAQSEVGEKAGRKAVKRHARTDKRKQSIKRYQQSGKGKQTVRRWQQTIKYQQAKKKVNATRRTRKTQAGGSYSADQWYSLCKFYNFRCLKCNKKLPFEKLTLDHVKPVSKGGSSDIWNTQPLCGKCNSSKNDKEIDYRKTLPSWIKRDGPVWQQNTLF